MFFICKEISVKLTLLLLRKKTAVIYQFPEIIVYRGATVAKTHNLLFDDILFVDCRCRLIPRRTSLNIVLFRKMINFKFLIIRIVIFLEDLLYDWKSCLILPPILIHVLANFNQPH